MILDVHLAELLSQEGDPQQLACALVDTANDAGGEGTVSAIVACVK